MSDADKIMKNITSKVSKGYIIQKSTKTIKLDKDNTIEDEILL